MEEISKQKGEIVIVAFLALGILLLLGTFFLSFTLTETKISKSQEVAAKAYYLSEAGINEAIWKLKNDPEWKTCFVSTSTEYNCLDCKSWQSFFSKNYTENSTTVVSIQNSSCAHGEIVATTTVVFSKGKVSQRVVKTKVMRNLGSLTQDSPLFTGSPSGESIIDSSKMNVYGNLFVNNNLRIRDGSVVNVYDATNTEEQEGKILVHNQCIFTNSSVTSSATCCADKCQTTSTCSCATNPENFDACKNEVSCPPKFVKMPSPDFDSYLQKAKNAQSQGQCLVIKEDVFGATSTLSTNCVFTENEFDDLLDKVGVGGTLILEHRANGFATSTYYVKGRIVVDLWRHLEINGVLIADGSVYIGNWGNGYLVIKDPGPGIPSGLLTKDKMKFGQFFSFWQDFEVTGLLYSQDQFTLESLPHTFNVRGGIIARKFYFDSGHLNPLNLYLDNDIIREAIWGGPNPPAGEPAEYSPVVTIEYWEESY